MGPSYKDTEPLWVDSALLPPTLWYCTGSRPYPALLFPTTCLVMCSAAMPGTVPAGQKL